MSSYVLLDKVTVTTDPYAILSIVAFGYTSVKLSWTNVSSESVTYRVADESGTPVTEEIELSGGSQNASNILDLTQGTTYKYYLERNEFGEWVRQTSSTTGVDYVQFTTLDTSLSVSVGSSSATVQWPQPPVTSNFFLDYTDSVTGTTKTVPLVDLIRNGDVVKANLSGLETSRNYSVVLKVNEGSVHELASLSFTTSESSSLVIEKTYASYVSLYWSGDASGEEDGEADYKIIGGIGSDTSQTYIESTTSLSGNITGLIPGEVYVFTLQRLEVNGSWSSQATVQTTMLTTPLNVESVGSESVKLSWSPLYTGAQYELRYSINSGSQDVFEDGLITGSEAIVSSLQSSTAYDFELYIYELGSPVGLATLGLGSAASARTDMSPLVYVAAGVTVVGVAGGAWYVMKK